MPPADAGSGHIFVANEGLTTLATIMSPTFAGSEFRSPLARQFPICRAEYQFSNYVKWNSKSETVAYAASISVFEWTSDAHVVIMWLPYDKAQFQYTGESCTLLGDAGGGTVR